MKILHTADWHVGRAIRGRSRTVEHEAVLAEIAAIADDERVDLVIVAGDVFDSAAPAPEAEAVAYQGLLALAGQGRTVIVLAGNHDNAHRLRAVAPLLDLGRVVTRTGFLAAADGGVIDGRTAAGEPWRVATVPFLSQRWVVRAAELLTADAPEHAGTYADRVARLVGALTTGFEPGAVNLVAAHLHIAGGVLGGGERLAHTIFEYAVSAVAFPAGAHYVALGHLHRAQAVAGPCPIRYSGSPLQLDFGETRDDKSVTIVEASPNLPAAAREVRLTAGRRLRVVRGTLDELEGLAVSAGDDWLKVVVREPPRLGLGEEARARLPNAVEVVVEDPAAPGPAEGGEERPTRQGRTPHELFSQYLDERAVRDPRLLALFDRLLDEVSS